MLFSFNACNKIADGPSYEVYLKGNTIRAFDVINDTLFVAIENSGVMIYEINNDNGLITLDSLSFSSVVGNPVSLDIQLSEFSSDKISLTNKEVKQGNVIIDTILQSFTEIDNYKIGVFSLLYILI